MAFRSQFAALAALAAGAVMAAVVAAPAHATDLRLPMYGHAHLPPVVAASAPAQHPEGVAWDPTRHAFLVSSLRHGTVSVVRADGSVRTLISDPRMISTLGIQVDARRNRVLVAFSDMGVGERTSPDTQMKVAGLGIFDLRTGTARHFVDLASVAGEGLHVANDIAVAPDGTAYVADSLSESLVQVDVWGHASVLVRDARFHAVSSPTGFGLNGIVWHPGGYLLAVKSWGGELFRITTGHKPTVTVVQTDKPIHNGDGLLLRRDGSLLAVTNPLGPDGISAVRLLRTRDDWTSATTAELLPWPDAASTTAAATPDGDYVLYGALDVLFGGGLSDNFDLRRADFTTSSSS
ncbi:MAG TPA: hypothetical protein VE287_05550 [Actinopolymorphaceae bacterium]|nr:hypothetical protein [Actinopolymorphaceae bacterium]